MKKIKYIFLSAIICIAAIALVFQSCNNENGVSSSDSSSKIIISSQYDHLDLPKEYQQVGQFHNEGLDTVFTEINKALYATTMQAKVKSKGNLQYMQKTLNSLDYNSIIKNGFLKYAKSNKTLNAHYSDCVRATNSTLKGGLAKVSSDSTIVLANLNQTQKALMDSINSALACQGVNVSFVELKEKLNKINKFAEQRLKKEDAMCIYSATSVAYCSYQYWRKNIVKWAYMFDSYNVGSDMCKDLTSACKVNLSKSKRFKIPGVGYENSDGSWTVAQSDLFQVTVTGQQTHIWNDYVLPIIQADAAGGAEAVEGAMVYATYIEVASAGTGTGPAIVEILTTVGISAGVASANQAGSELWNYYLSH